MEDWDLVPIKLVPSQNSPRKISQSVHMLFQSRNLCNMMNFAVYPAK